MLSHVRPLHLIHGGASRLSARKHVCRRPDSDRAGLSVVGLASPPKPRITKADPTLAAQVKPPLKNLENTSESTCAVY
jgi:hypothetical protein